MSNIDIDAIEARANAATPVPWKESHPDGGITLDDSGILCPLVWSISTKTDTAWIPHHENEYQDAVFIAAARQDVPALCAEVRRLRAELADVRARADEADAEIGRLVAELAMVRLRTYADVESATARAQTAEANAAAARAEAERLRELIKDAADGAGYAVTFGNMLVKGETIDNCGDPDAVLYLLGEAKAIEDKLRAALRESNDGN